MSRWSCASGALLLLALCAAPLAAHGAQLLPGRTWSIQAADQGQVKQAEWDKPWFCHELDCPPFKLIQNFTDLGLELREYRAGKWVSTKVNSTMYEKAVTAGFWRLFKYIQGDNEPKTKVDMTAPVTVRITPGQGPACDDLYVISFYIPEAHQADPPVPTNPDVFLRAAAGARYYVSGFGGWATGAVYLDKAEQATKLLTAAGMDFDASHFLTAGYDSPFRLTGRHNEVWIPAAAAPTV